MLEALCGGRAEQVDRVRERRLDRKEGGERLAGLYSWHGELETCDLTGVRAQDSKPAGVRQHGHAPAARNGLAREEGGDIEEARQRVGSNHAGLVEDGVDGRVRARQGSGVRARSLLARAGAAALHRQNGLLSREPPGDARELAWVAEGLEVEEDEVGVGVVLPPLEEVVGRHVCLVTDRDEAGEAEPASLGPLEQCEAERTGLRREADSACGERPRREGRVHPHGGRRDSEAVRADEPRAVCADEREQALLPLDPCRPRLGEPGRDHAECPCPGPQRFLGGADHVLARKADHAKVDRIADLPEGAVRAHAGDRLAGAVDRVRRTREPARQNVAKDEPTDRAGPRGGAHDGHRPGREERS